MVSGAHIFSMASIIVYTGIDRFLSMSYPCVCRWKDTKVCWELDMEALSSFQMVLPWAGLVNIASVFSLLSTRLCSLSARTVSVTQVLSLGTVRGVGSGWSFSKCLKGLQSAS